MMNVLNQPFISYGKNRQKNGQVFALVVLAIALSGCSIEASISSITEPVSYKTKVNGAEFVSGSSQYNHTLLRSFKINSSAGSMTESIQSETPRGYKMFSSVQGALISSQEVP